MELSSVQVQKSFIVGNLTGVIQNIRKSIGVDNSGIIGSDVMKKHGIIIYYKKEKALTEYGGSLWELIKLIWIHSELLYREQPVLPPRCRDKIQ